MATPTDLRTRALSAGLAGVLTLYPIGRAPRWAKAAFVAVPTALAAAGGGVVAASVDWSTSRKVAVAVGAPLWMAATSALSVDLDRRIEEWLRPRVKSPRVVMAAGAAVLAAAMTPGSMADGDGAPREGHGAGG